MSTSPQITANASLQDQRPWYQHRWPWLLMLGPALVVVAGSYTAYLAVTREDAMVVGDYYKEGKAINKDLRRDRVASKLGISFQLSYDAVAGSLKGNVHSMGAPLAGKYSIHMAHPTRPEKDIRFEVQADENGDFKVALPMLELARWQILLENEKRDWRVAGIWLWPQQRSVNLTADKPADE